MASLLPLWQPLQQILRLHSTKLLEPFNAQPTTYLKSINSSGKTSSTLLVQLLSAINLLQSFLDMSTHPQDNSMFLCILPILPLLFITPAESLWFCLVASMLEIQSTIICLDTLLFLPSSLPLMTTTHMKSSTIWFVKMASQLTLWQIHFCHCYSLGWSFFSQ